MMVVGRNGDVDEDNGEFCNLIGFDFMIGGGEGVGFFVVDFWIFVNCIYIYNYVGLWLFCCFIFYFFFDIVFCLCFDRVWMGEKYVVVEGDGF